ncbi:MAG: ribonuclease R [Cyclobacteriaceae bacterium]|nr:ribonuclease R [Cyclobacteriaceae bacterium]
MTKKKKRGGKNVNYSDIKKLIQEILNDKKNKKISHRQIIKKLGVHDKKTKNVIKSILTELSKNKPLGQKYTSAAVSGREIIGKVDFVNPRFAYIVSEELEEDVMVKSENLKFALDDDTVRVQLFQSKSRSGRIEGRVVEITNRFRKEFVGRVEISANYAFVVPDFKKMHYDIFVPSANLNKAIHDDKVVVEITKWPAHDKSPEGKVITLLGKSGENEAEIHSIMAEFGLPFKFPDNVNHQAKKIQEGVTDKEVLARKDFREILTFTIDPFDAKDFDDALSIRKLSNGNHEIGIHIADVTHYIRPNTLLEEEARDRATSVYLVDRTIPMLPEKISNELCSLRPFEDKLTFSAVFELDDNAHIKKEWFGKTVIHSNRRFTYEEAQERIENKSGDFFAELISLNNLALKLKAERFMRGSINFETTEVKFDLDEKGKPIGLLTKERKDAHKLVEEFMLLANKRVAEFIYKMKKGKTKNTFVYRTHDYPDIEKLNTFSMFAKKFGHELKVDNAAVSRSLNNLIEDIEGKPEQNVLQTLAIRSMAKAIYTTEAKGHFGLAFPHYTHFTSPIRRYPDMMVHRMLLHYIGDGQSFSDVSYEKKCQHSSQMEKRAADAERASIKYKQVEFMETMLNQEFEGIVSGVTEWGIFVEIISTKCEGMARLSDLKDDYYIHEPEQYRVVGQSHGNTITLGDTVHVKVLKTDINRRTIDLEMLNSKN